MSVGFLFCYNDVMALSWSDRRRYTYSAAAIFILLLLGWVVWATFFSTPATCFNAKQDGTEIGIDCGGTCALLCQNQTHEPLVSWARAFRVASSTYVAAAYVRNPNAGAGAHAVVYSFQLFDADNQLVVERDGVAELPPIATIPIVESNVPVGNRTVTHALFAFSSLPAWYTVPKAALPNVQITNQVLASDGTRLSFTLQNDTTADVTNLAVAGVLFDSRGIALAASKSIVPMLAHRSQQQVVFTWPLGNPNALRAEITLLPSF